MAQVSDFDIIANRRFVPDYYGPTTVSGDPYDPKTHRYRRAYVNPTSWLITLVARRGFFSNSRIASERPGETRRNPESEGTSRPRAPGALPRRTSPRTLARFRDSTDRLQPSSVADFLDQILTPPEPQAPGGGSSREWPQNFVAYEWTIREEAGPDPFEFSRRVARPSNGRTPGERDFTLSVELPREGRYTITCRATFTDRAPEATTIRYLLRDFLIASTGDSFASGQGNPDQPGRLREFPGPGSGGFVSQCDWTTFSKALADGIEVGRVSLPRIPVAYQQDPIWLEPKAYRSLRSGPALAARLLQRQSRRNDGTVVDDLITFVSFARSGAQVCKGLLKARSNDDFIREGQIEEVRQTLRRRTVDALLISIGGNDVGFAGVLKDLVIKDFSLWRIGKDRAGREELVRRVEERLRVNGPVEVDFDKLDKKLAALRRQIPIRDIYITTYPVNFFESRDRGELRTEVCELFSGPDLDITPADVKHISQLGGKLNDLIRKKARDFGWQVVDIDATGEFTGRGYCALKDDRCWVKAEESCNRQGDFDGTMHPNARGHAMNGFYLAALLTERMINRRQVAIEPPVITPAPSRRRRRPRRPGTGDRRGP